MRIPKQWTFNNEEVAGAFDQHVREQLPWYDLATQAIAHIARHYAQPHSIIYDIGASTGNITNAIKEDICQREIHAVSIENSKEMVNRWDGIGSLVETDAQNYDYQPFSVAILNLTLQFLTKADRQNLLNTLKRKVLPGGAIIILDKFAPQNGYISTVLYRQALAAKLQQGATPKEIIEKELSLTGVQRPLDPEEITGTEFFRYGHFAGYIIEG